MPYVFADPPLLTVKDVSGLFGVHPQTVRQWVKSGKLSGRYSGRCWYFEKDEVERLAGRAIRYE